MGAAAAAGGKCAGAMHHLRPSRPLLAASSLSPGCAAAPLTHHPPARQQRMASAAAKQEPGTAPTEAAAAAAAADPGQQQQQAAVPPPVRLPPSRLQQEVGLLVALDVEYTHLRLAGGGRHVSLPAEVCAVDAEGRVLLYEHCNPLGERRRPLQRWPAGPAVGPLAGLLRAACLRQLPGICAAVWAFATLSAPPACTAALRRGVCSTEALHTQV